MQREPRGLPYEKQMYNICSGSPEGSPTKEEKPRTSKPDVLATHFSSAPCSAGRCGLRSPEFRRGDDHEGRSESLGHVAVPCHGRIAPYLPCGLVYDVAFRAEPPASPL